MPVRGFKSLTIHEEHYRLLKELAVRQGVSMARLIEDIIADITETQRQMDELRAWLRLRWSEKKAREVWL